MNTRALVMFARPPILGRVKTRLQPTFSPEESLALYEAMLADGLERMLEAARDLAVPFLSWSEACDPSGDLAPLLKRISVEYQMGDDLGERMATTLQSKLRGGFKQVVLIGSDSPHFPLDYLHQAFEALAAVDLVIGPAEDGGYYLMGARRLHPRLFQRMPWGAPEVLSITRQRIKAGRITHHELPRWYDLDTPADLSRLWKDLQHMKKKGMSDLPHRTWSVLAGIIPGRLR